MPSLVSNLYHKKLITPPKFLPDNVQYECIMGSQAYGTSSDASDTDVYGFAMPPVDTLFPNMAGEIHGFDVTDKFEQYQQHHIQEGDKQWDVTIFNITKYFSLLMKCSPNVVDSLFVPLNCVLHSTVIGNHVRENRRIFLHKGAYDSFHGYARSQLHKMNIKTPAAGSKRDADIAKHGFDTKFAMHLVRLAYECEQILIEGDLDLTRHREHLKAIRRGEVPEADIHTWFSDKEKYLKELHEKSTLPHSADKTKVKSILLQCIEMHYGNLDKFAYVNPDRALVVLRQISSILEANRQIL